ncbi:tetratricopeptide repeat protein [Rufibacter roseus]|uniref:Regulator of microtubule dynamics protein 1 n=1 Tax=Rufibacter roseus TaxID=1567108 RepID=A0ABW2DTK2_9BACT|nr:hypothetical protein [Rufibacter roseus]
MRSIYRTIWLLTLLISIPTLSAYSGGIGSEKLLWEANQLFKEYKDTEALAKYELLLEKTPNHLEALYKTSILFGRIGNRYSDDTHKSLYFQKALAHAQRALYVDSANADANYAMALALGYLCQTGTLKERLGYLDQIKLHVDKALEYEPNHAGAWHLKGRWAYKVANLSLGEKAASKLFLNSSFPEVTNQQAIEALSKAVDLSPSNLLFYYDLARVQKDASMKGECILTLQKALDQKLVTSEDLELSRKCKILLQEVLKVRS